MIINRKTAQTLVAFLALSITLSACGGKKKDAEANEKATADSLNRPENIRLVAAIAKVEPANGLIELSSEVSGIVVEILKKEGDSVKKGDVLFKLDQKSENLLIEENQQNILTQTSRIAANQGEIKQQEASLREKEQDLAISKQLAATGAETQQNVAIKEKERDVLLANLQIANAQLSASQGELKNLKNKLNQSSANANNRVVVAKESGVLVNIDVKIGAAVTAYTPFATLAPNGNLILHGEIDEMFANRVKIGQNVSVHFVGNAAQITTGKVMYLSPILDNKSLFYETTGESSDRRIRKFKVALSSSEGLLINAKVECKITID